MLFDPLGALLHDPLRRPDDRPLASFSPRSLFLAGEQGVWYDPSDLSTLFQDSAGTTPVTAAGQPVGRILDKSGRGNHAVQATAGSRPTLQQDASGFYYLAFDGTDDGMATGNIDFSATDTVNVFGGLLKASDAAAALLCELGTGGAVAGSFAFLAPGAASPQYGFRTVGSSLDGNTAAAVGFAAPISNVVTGIGQISTDTRLLRVNGVQVATNVVDQGTGNLANGPLNIAQRAGGTLRLIGRIYSLIARGATMSAAQIAQTERYAGSRMGIPL